MIHPKRLRVEPRLPGRERPADRHAPALLLRRQPGRHRRRRADRGRARLHALGADRAGDELQPAADALGRLRPVRPGAYPAYPDELIRPLLLSLIQTLWDRGDPDGYAWHMTDDPYPNTPAHTVLLHMAFGDHQVANVATEVEARTIGARLRLPAVDPGRSTDVHPFYGIEPITQVPVPRQRAGRLGHRARCARGGAPRHAAAADHQHGAAAGPRPARHDRPRGRAPSSSSPRFIDGELRRRLRRAALPRRRAGPGREALRRARRRRGCCWPRRRARTHGRVVHAPTGAARLRPARRRALPVPVAERLLPQARPPGADARR